MMETQKLERPQIHQSMLSPMCWWQWLPVHGQRFGIWPVYEPVPPSSAMVTGSTGHETAAFNLKYKMENGVCRPLDEVTDFARDCAHRLWDDGVLLNEAERLNPLKSKDAMVQTVIEVSKLHHQKIVPMLYPTAIEWPFVIELTGGQFYDVAGTIDCLEENRVVDFKFAKGLTRTNLEHAAKTVQGATYCEAFRVHHGGRYPQEFRLAVIAKTKTPTYQILSAEPDESWINPLFRRIEWLAQAILRARELIETTGNEYAAKEIFAPVSPEGPHSWVCTQFNCGFADKCKAWTGR